jgi:tRNA threonylcarbamoyladenosine modification (KEOPS) complex  Pcc1 subunit
LKDRFGEIPAHREEKRLCLLDIAETLQSYRGATEGRFRLLQLSHAVRKLAEAP